MFSMAVGTIGEWLKLVPFLDGGYIAVAFSDLICELREHRGPSGGSCRDLFCPFYD